MKKLGIVFLSIMLALTLAACKNEEVTTTKQAAVKPNLNQFRFDLANAMLEAKSANVDTIATATDSSNGWIQAVTRALEKAKSTTDSTTYVDGTYTADGDKRQFGYETATVVIANGEITEITLNRLSPDGTVVDYTQWTGQ